MRENIDQKNSKYRDFLRSVRYPKAETCHCWLKNVNHLFLLTPPFFCSSLFCKTYRSHFFYRHFLLVVQICIYTEWYDLVIVSFNVTLKLNSDSGIPGLWTLLCKHNFLDPGFQNVSTKNQIFWIKFFLKPWKCWMKRSLPCYLFISVCLTLLY